MANIFQAIAEARSSLGGDAISTDDEDLKIHGYSEWSSINIDQLPVAVAYPKSTEEVSQIAKVCHKYKVPMSRNHITSWPVDVGLTFAQFHFLEVRAWKPISLLLMEV